MNRCNNMWRGHTNTIDIKTAMLIRNCPLLCQQVEKLHTARYCDTTPQTKCFC